MGLQVRGVVTGRRGGVLQVGGGEVLQAGGMEGFQVVEGKVFTGREGLQAGGREVGMGDTGRRGRFYRLEGEDLQAGEVL